jgi:hypothetical protein
VTRCSRGTQIRWVRTPTRARAREAESRSVPGLEGGLTYRPGIGRQHSLSDTAIRKRAKANGWTPDLSGAVRCRVRESLVREGGSREPACHRRAQDQVSGHEVLRRDLGLAAGHPETPGPRTAAAGCSPGENRPSAFSMLCSRMGGCTTHSSGYPTYAHNSVSD